MLCKPVQLNYDTSAVWLEKSLANRVGTCDQVQTLVLSDQYENIILIGPQQEPFLPYPAAGQRTSKTDYYKPYIQLYYLSNVRH